MKHRSLITCTIKVAWSGFPDVLSVIAPIGRASFRIFSYALVIVNLLSFGTFLYAIAPYTSYFFFNDWRFWRYIKYYHKYFFYSASYIFALLTRQKELIKDVLPLTSPAMDGPDPDRFRLVKDWNYPPDSCGACNRCCTFVVPCCFLDKTNRCICYGSLFWRYFNCGRFPSSEELIAYCGCGKFEARD